MSQKDQIVEAFERLVARDGYAKAKLDDVARELHISKKTIYTHFESKREIYECLVEGVAASERRRLKEHTASLPTVSDKVRGVLAMVFESMRRHRSRTTRSEWLAEYEVAADAFRKAYGDLLRELVEEGIADGEFRDGDSALVERMVAAMCVEYALMLNVDPGYNVDQELTERVVRFIA